MSPWRPPFEHEFQYALRDGLRVVAVRDLFRRDGREVHGAIRVIDGLLRVRQHERRGRLLARVVPGIRLRHHEAVLERLTPLRDAPRVLELLACMPAVADHVQRPFHGVGRFTSNAISGASNPLTRQCCGVLPSAATVRAAISTTSAMPRVFELLALRRGTQIAAQVSRLRASRVRERLRLRGRRRIVSKRRPTKPTR